MNVYIFFNVICSPEVTVQEGDSVTISFYSVKEIGMICMQSNMKLICLGSLIALQ
jgi:hypothetical protein